MTTNLIYPHHSTRHIDHVIALYLPAQGQYQAIFGKDLNDYLGLMDSNCNDDLLDHHGRS